MKKKEILFIICFFILFIMSFTTLTSNLIEKINERVEEKTQEEIKSTILKQYNKFWHIYPIDIEKLNDNTYTASVIYYDLKYTYEDVWIVTINDRKTEIRKVSDK